MLRIERDLYIILIYMICCRNNEALSFLLEIKFLKTSINTADNREYTLMYYIIKAY